MHIKIKCSYCGEISRLDNGGCTSCGRRGGWLQEPKIKKVGQLTLHLEETLRHIPTGNEYQIKEFQDKGIVAIVTRAILPNILKRQAYISNSTILEYIRI